MEDKIRTLTYWEAGVSTVELIASNPLFKIVLIPIILLSIASANFGVYVLVVITDITRYMSTDIKQESPFSLMVRYMTTPFLHYVIILLNEIIVTFFISSVIRQSFCAFTTEYILVNYDKYHSLGSGQINAIIQRRLVAVEEFLRLLILRVFHDLIYIIVAFLKMYTDIDERAFFANIALFIFYIVTVWYIIKMRTNFRFKYNDAYNIVSNKCYGILMNYDVIKAYTNEKLEEENLDKKLQVVQDRSIVFEVLTSLAECAQKNALVIPNGYIIYLAMSGIFFTKMSNNAGFQLYNQLFLDVKTRIGRLTNDILRATQYMTDIADSRIVEAKLDDDLKGFPISSFKKSIVFKGVSLYIQDNRICSDVNITIYKGEKVAVVGKNGSGKSTFLNSLLRMRDYEGSITLDGIEMKDISKYSQRKLISYVPQNPGIKEGSLIENLKYGRNDISDEKLIELCKLYGSHEIFSTLPDGYSTEAGELGKYLSGGQKQRISFLRGVLKNGDIFILDEHTSNLDSKSQCEIIDYLFTLLKYKTTIAILHNLEHLNKFDKIVGFHEGVVRVYEKYDDYLIDKHLY